MQNDLRTPEERDETWVALEGLRSSQVVDETRAYVESIERHRRRWRNAWRMPFVGALASAMAVCLLVVIFVRAMVPHTDTRIQTVTGELRTVALSDGSKVTLDSDTRIRVHLSGARRTIELLGGRAHFDVAHDPMRPFIVSFGGSTVTALGTSFDVSIPPLPNAVTLLEGKVVVRAAHGAKALLKPGERIVQMADGRLMPPETIDPNISQAWRERRIEFQNITIPEALAEINRYSDAKIIVDDSSIADKRLSGTFKAGDTEAAIKAFCVFFDLRVVRRSADKITLAPA